MNESGFKHLRLIVFVIILLGLLLKFFIIFRPLGNLTIAPLYDDSFYSLGIARNYAAGKGFTFDGHIRTDGFQPLYVFLMVPVYKALALEKEDLPIKTGLVIHAFLAVVSGLLAFSLIRSIFGTPAGLIVLTAFMLDPRAVQESINGLETGLATFFIILGTLLYVRGFIKPQTPSLKYALALGVSIGLGILARLDHGLFALAIGIDLLLRARKLDSVARMKSFTCLAATTMVSAIIAGPWFLYVKSNFGSFMPTSGRAVRSISIAYGDQFLKSRWRMGQKMEVADTLDDTDIPLWYYAGSMEKALKDSLGSFPLVRTLFNMPGIIILGLIFAWVILKKMNSPPEWVKGVGAFRFLMFAWCFAFFAYSFYVFGQYFYSRYFFPFSVIIGFLVLGAGTAAVHEQFKDRRWRWAIAVVFLTFSLVWSAPESKKLLQRKYNSEYYVMAMWARDNTPPDTVLGVFQAGTVGYLSGRRTINMDGVTNADALDAINRKSIDIYSESEKINYLADWPAIIGKLFINRSSNLQSLNQYERIGKIGTFILYRKRDKVVRPYEAKD